MAGGSTGMHPALGEYAGKRRGGLSAYEIDFADKHRALGRGWQTIADMLKRPVADVRAVCDDKWGKGS